MVKGMKRGKESGQGRQLRVAFFDLNDPFDPQNWSGIPAHIISFLRDAGVAVLPAGPNFLFPRKSINWILHRYYRFGKKLFYHIDRDAFWVRLFTQMAHTRLKSMRADAVVTAFPAFAAYLPVGRPIFMIHDATWGQVVQTYPWFSPQNQPERIVANGYALERMAYRRDDVYPILTSEWAASRAAADYDIDRDRIHVLPFGPNLANPPDPSTVERALRWRGRKVCRLLFVGKEWTRKGGPAAVEVTAALIQSGVPTELHVVGPAELRAGTKPSTALPPFVHCHGFLRKNVPEEAALIERLYMESDFFILPARAEALGIVFAEAAAYGLPCLGTAVGGISSVLRDGVGGALFSPDNSAPEMASWIKRMYFDRQAYLAMARSARADYEARLTSAAYGRRLAEIIQQTLEGDRERGDRTGSGEDRLAETA